MVSFNLTLIAPSHRRYSKSRSCWCWPAAAPAPAAAICPWQRSCAQSSHGQLAFFAEYLEATGLFERWLKSCPLSYTSPNAPDLVDVLSTWMVSILDGQRRYAHVGALRGDGVAPSILVS